MTIEETTEEQETVTCTSCDKEHEPDDCASCADCHEQVCEDCRRTDQNGNPVCESCGESYHMCEQCECTVHTDDAQCGDDQTFCQSCYDELYSTCDDCGEGVRTDRAQTDGNGTCVCNSCYENGWAYCASCECLSSNTHFCDSCDETRCSDCSCDCSDKSEVEDLHEHAHSLRSIGEDAITDYHPEVNWEFKKSRLDNPAAPYFGVELEIETGSATDTCCRLVGKELAGHCIASHDGSLSSGFEIVFTPHKRQAFREMKLPKILDMLSKAKATSHKKGTCGLHVHIERIPFLRKKLPLVVSNRLENTYNMADLFQHMFNQLNRELFKFSKRTTEQCERFAQFRRSSYDRYCAVNLSNSNTIDIRLWRGTLEPKRFSASISLSLALLDFMQATSLRTLIGCDLKLQRAFKAWLERQGEYQALTAYLRESYLFGFCPNPKKFKLTATSNNHPDAEETTGLCV